MAFTPVAYIACLSKPTFPVFTSRQKISNWSLDISRVAASFYTRLVVVAGSASRRRLNNAVIADRCVRRHMQPRRNGANADSAARSG